MRRVIVLLTTVVLMVFAAEQLLAIDAARTDWPQWRGPERDGHSADKGLLDAWPKEGPPLLWRGDGLGYGYASVSVAGDRIYTMGQVRGTVCLIALRRDSGEKIWETSLGEGGAPNCSPTVDGDLVFGVTYEGDLVCCNANSGDVQWRKNYGRDFGGQMMSGWGYSESPLVDGDRLICTPGAQDAMLAALDKRSGEVLWKTVIDRDLGPNGGDGAAYSSVVISNGGGVKQYVQLVGRGVIGVSAADGRLLWNYNRVANGTANCSTPVISGDYVFASTGYDTGAVILQLHARGGRVGAREVRFFEPREVQNHHGGMVLVGDYLYLGHGHNNGLPLCLHIPSGREMWRPGRGAGTGSAAVAYADGHLYFRYENGVMALIEANPNEYRAKGSFTIASIIDKSWPHPVIAGGCLYLRDQDVLLCYDLRKQSQ
jgi:outer membrane protein assembly factor BamB